MKQEKCDKCGTDILMGECSCGKWFEPGKHPEQLQILEKAILQFLKSGKDIESGDHHTGVCFVFFKGDYDMCMAALRGIQEMQKFARERT